MAQRGINKVIILGRLTRDPEVKYMPSGSAVVNFSLATSETWRDKATGEQKEVSEFHNVVAYGKAAEIIGEYARKGSHMYVEGQLSTRKWQDKNTGENRYATEIKIPQMGGVFQFLGGKNDGQQSGGNQSAANTAWGQPQQPSGPTHSGGGQPRQQRQQAPQNGAQNEPPMDFDDDIPF